AEAPTGLAAPPAGQQSAHGVEVELPRRFSARSLGPHLQTAFFQSAALSFDFVTRIALEDTDVGSVRALSQWRLDYPSSPGTYLPSDQTTRALLGHAERLLQRGSTPIQFETVETALRDLIPSGVSFSAEAVQAACSPTIRLDDVPLDSDEERL